MCEQCLLHYLFMVLPMSGPYYSYSYTFLYMFLHYINKPKRFWDSVLWSDETKLELLGLWLRRKKETCTEKDTLPSLKHAGGSVMLCGHLWWDLKKAVAARKPKNICELKAFTHEDWAKILRNVSRSWCLAMHHVCSRVIIAKGCKVLHGSFANPHPPVPIVLKTASDPFPNSSTNYIPHPSRPAIN